MTVRFSIVCGLIFGLTSCSWFDFSSSKVTVDDIQNPYVPLFNGENLDGWVVMGDPEGWSVQDGVIRSEGGRGGNWLRSVQEYSDFSLILDYKISPGGNSGVFIRCAEQGNPWETGYECQISNEQPPRDELHCTGSLYGYVKADPRPDETPDEWHTCEIVSKKNRILIFVDGVNTVDVDQSKIENIQDKPLQGYIGLQDSHTEEGHSIEFRNIRLRELQ
ncbi:MAG: 3-keto-disaccharide hydrolase [Candidatus Hinthialibacter sp.]